MGHGAGLEGLGTGQGKPEGIGQPADCVEREANGERVLDLVTRDTGSEAPRACRPQPPYLPASTCKACAA
jgi:hypothetical protein